MRIRFIIIYSMNSLPVLHNPHAVKTGVGVTILIADLFSVRYFQLKRQLQVSLINYTFCANLVIYKIP